MNRVVLHYSLSVLLVLFATIEAHAQMRSRIAVQGEELNNDLLVMNIERDGTICQLTCKRGAPSCSTLNNGRHQMVELPENFGAYDCKDDVEVYAEIVNDPQRTEDSGNTACESHRCQRLTRCIGSHQWHTNAIFTWAGFINNEILWQTSSLRCLLFNAWARRGSVALIVVW